MKLSTGKVAFPIEFDNGDKAVIYFNPNDKDIQERIDAFQNSLENKLKKIDIEKYRNTFEDGKEFNIDFDNPEKLFDMTIDDLKSLKQKSNVIREIEKEYNKAIKEEIDVVFNSNISDVVFRYCEPFDVVIIEDENGNQNREIYIMHFMQWLMVEMKKHSVGNKNAMEKHISKYR